MSLQSLITKSLGPEINCIPLIKKGEDIRFLLESVGKLYTLGINPSIEKLYPKVEYPVSKGTPSISSLIKWDHNKSYTVYKYPEFYNQMDSNKYTFTIDLQVSKQF